MWFLVFSILCSVTVSVFLKIAYRYQLQVSQAIAANYVMATLLSLIVLRPDFNQLIQADIPYFVLLALGLLLPSIFIVMARAVNHAGIIRSDAAQRLSLLIPLLAAFLFFGEAFDGWKLSGIACGLLAILCLSFSRPINHSHPETTQRGAVALDAPPSSFVSGKSDALPAASFKEQGLWLFGVWLGYGLIDVLFKQLAQAGMAFIHSLFISFILAGSLMFIGLLLRRTTWAPVSLLAGLLLGLFNFGNIYFYIRAHQQFPANPALVFAAMNIGVISLGTVTGAVFFKERINLLIALGLALAIGAIFLLLP